jgi:hypothetical protein
LLSGIVFIAVPITNTIHFEIKPVKVKCMVRPGRVEDTPMGRVAD